MYDDIITLKTAVMTYDSFGNEIPTYVGRTVYAMPRGVYSNEFYNAAQAGFKPSVTFVLSNRNEYQGEKRLSFHGTEYSVIRVDWDAQRDAIRLICEERIGDGIIQNEDRVDFGRADYMRLES